MTLVTNWTKLYTQDDAFRASFRKQDLIYLLSKFGRKKDGTPPTQGELDRLKQPQLVAIWWSIKPFEFGKDPKEVAVSS
jgi:hypothetical protein